MEQQKALKAIQGEMDKLNEKFFGGYTKEQWAKWYAHKSNKEAWCERHENEEADYKLEK